LRTLLFITLFYVSFSTFAQSNTSMFRTAGSAVPISDSCFQLTPSTLKQSGSVWFSKPIDLRENVNIEVMINLGQLDSSGADGIAFVLQPNANILGGMGGGLGYAGISPSLAIEFDTWQNDDPPFDHIALVKNGVPFHYMEPDFTLQGPFELLPSGANAEDGRFRSVKIEWDSRNMILRCYYDGQLKIDYQGNIMNDIFNGSPMVYWGFTASTEGYVNEQSVCMKYISTPCQVQKIHLPTAFTPNGDQLNDMFYPLSTDRVAVKTLRIFNRWGQMIFEKKGFPANDKRYAWDGKFIGTEQPSGLYSYLLVIECDKAKPIEIKGTVTLLR
jgi:gliding motility-associated-like protein